MEQYMHKFNKKRIDIFFVASVLAFASFPLHAVPRSAQELVPCGSWVYDAVTAVSIEQGTVNFADNAPLTIQQIKTYLSEVDYGSLSEPGKDEYDAINSFCKEKNFSFNSGLLSVGLEPSVNMEAFWKSNDSIDWIYDRYNRQPFLDAPAVFSCGDYFTMSCDLALQQNKGMSLENGNYTNIPLNTDQADVNFPSSAYFSTGAKITDDTGVSFQLGLGPRSVGRTLTGSVILSDYMTGTSWGQLTAYSQNLRYTASVTQFNVDKYLYLHELDARFFKKVSVTVMEGMLVYAPLELRYLNPWTIYHGMAPWRDYEDTKSDSESHTCAYMCFKLSYVPVDGVRIYGLFAQDQYQTEFEMKNWPDNDTPNGLGGQLGTELYIPCGEGYVHACLEGYYADPYLYIKEDPNWSLVRTYSENINGKNIFYEWVGSPFGPDTIAGELSVGYEVPQKFSVDAKYLYMCRGEMSGTSVFNEDYWGGQKTATLESGTDGYAAWAFNKSGKRKDTTPTGTPEYVNRISVKGTWNYKKWLTVALQPGYVIIFNHNHAEGETAYGFEAALSVRVSL